MLDKYLQLLCLTLIFYKVYWKLVHADKQLQKRFFKIIYGHNINFSLKESLKRIDGTALFPLKSFSLQTRENGKSAVLL